MEILRYANWAIKFLACKDLVYVWIVFFSGRCAFAFNFCRFRVLFMRPTSLKFSNFNFKTGSHDTIYTFKNYFVIVFLVFNNKRYPNKHLLYLEHLHQLVQIFFVYFSIKTYIFYFRYLHFKIPYIILFYTILKYQNF